MSVCSDRVMWMDPVVRVRVASPLGGGASGLVLFISLCFCVVLLFVATLYCHTKELCLM